jgi:SnoaL-like domain
MDRIAEILEIHRLKALYFRLMDEKRWDEWAEVFTEDFVGIYDGPHPQLRFEGRAQIVAENRKILATARTVHHGHMPEIELTSATTATGIWAMFDYVELPEFTLRGYGHYHDEYVKQGGRWRIKATRLTRLRCDVTPGPAAAGAAAR